MEQALPLPMAAEASHSPDSRPTLRSRLATSARIWVEAWAAFEEREAGRLVVAGGKRNFSLTQLARRITGTPQFFDQLEASPQGPTIGTLERFADFFAAPPNWPPNPEGLCLVPEEAREFCHAVGFTPPPQGASPDNLPDPIGARTIATAPAPRGAERDAVRSAASCPPSEAADSAPDADALPPVGRPASGDMEVLP